MEGKQNRTFYFILTLFMKRSLYVPEHELALETLSMYMLDINNRDLKTKSVLWLVHMFN